MLNKYFIELKKMSTYVEACRDWHEHMMKEAQEYKEKENKKIDKKEYYGHLGAFMALTGVMIEIEEAFKSLEEK